MPTRASRFLASLREPAYTGENRCLPCTVLNVLIAGVVALAAALFARPAVGAVVLVASLSTIYLRGYLVPGTPELTKRYFPDRLLRTLGKAPELPDPGETVDVEVYLHDVGVLETGPDEELVLSTGVREAWEHRIDEAATGAAAAAGDLLGLADPGVEERGEACVVTDGGLRAADWPSRAALLADLGAVPALRERDPDWSDRGRAEQGRVLASLRVFLDACPSCGGEPVLGEETVESCCREAAVYTYSCTDCGARLLEIEQ